MTDQKLHQRARYISPLRDDRLRIIRPEDANVSFEDFSRALLAKAAASFGMSYQDLIGVNRWPRQ